MTTKPGIMCAIFAALVLNVATVAAQQPLKKPAPVPAVPALPSIPAVDPIAEAMFPPDLIMRHSRRLELTDAQKTFMRDEIQRTTTRFNELQWQLEEAKEALTETMKSHSVNEQQALTLLDRVLDTEREIKRLHIGLGIRLKNQLTLPQQEKLQHLRTTRPTE